MIEEVHFNRGLRWFRGFWVIGFKVLGEFFLVNQNHVYLLTVLAIEVVGVGGLRGVSGKGTISNDQRSNGNMKKKNQPEAQFMTGGNSEGVDEGGYFRFSFASELDRILFAHFNK